MSLHCEFCGGCMTSTQGGIYYPQWKVDLFANRNAGKCICRLSIPGVLRDRNHPDCPQHGQKG